MVRVSRGLHRFIALAFYHIKTKRAMGHAKLFAISETILLLFLEIVNKKSQISA
jgi:hypothetical protein